MPGPQTASTGVSSVTGGTRAGDHAQSKRSNLIQLAESPWSVSVTAQSVWLLELLFTCNKKALKNVESKISCQEGFNGLCSLKLNKMNTFFFKTSLSKVSLWLVSIFKDRKLETELAQRTKNKLKQKHLALVFTDLSPLCLQGFSCISQNRDSQTFQPVTLKQCQNQQPKKWTISQSKSRQNGF